MKQRKQDKRTIYSDDGMSKFCHQCNEFVLLENWRKWKSKGRDKLESYCKKCARKKARDYEKRKYNPQKHRAKALYNRYGLTTEEYNAIEAKQDHRCAICGRSDYGQVNASYFVVDHNHKSGKIRGLLCHSCNRGLGMFGDNADILIEAAAYLESHDIA